MAITCAVFAIVYENVPIKTYNIHNSSGETGQPQYHKVMLCILPNMT
jgi:hypothetical protein